MILVYDNYIRVRSQQDLRRENSNSQQRIYIAGGGVGMPGASSLPANWSNPLGILPPNTFYSTDHPGGDSLRGSLSKNWTSSAGVGQGSVGGPSTTPMPPYDDHQPIPSTFFNHGIADNLKTVDGSQRYRPSNLGTTTNNMMPNDVYRSGSLYKGSDGSVGKDINALTRERFCRLYPKRQRGF